VAELLSSPTGLPWPVVSGRLVKRMVDDLGITEGAARWTVETWAVALEIVPPSQLATQGAAAERTATVPTQAPPPPNPPQPPPPRVGPPAAAPPSRGWKSAGRVVHALLDGVAKVVLSGCLGLLALGAIVVVVNLIGSRSGGPPPSKKEEARELTLAERLREKGIEVSQNEKGDVVRASFARAKLTDDDLQQLRSFTELQELDLSGATLSESWLESLGELHGLQKLNLSRSKLDERGLDHVKKLRSLTSLDLSHVEQLAFPEAGPGVFSELQELNLVGAQLKEGS